MRSRVTGAIGATAATTAVATVGAFAVARVRPGRPPLAAVVPRVRPPALGPTAFALSTLAAVCGLVLLTRVVAVRRRTDAGGGVLVVGDDPAEIERVATALDATPVGYVGPPAVRADGGGSTGVADPAGRLGENGRVGALDGLASAIDAHGADTVALGFERVDRADREALFHALATCRARGVDAVIRAERSAGILVATDAERRLLAVDLAPWSRWERVTKRAFDVAFACLALTALLPVAVAVALAVTFEDGGPVLYRQERTARWGDTVPIYKFRSMRPGGERVEPGAECDRITRVGRVIRETHLDEIPQLWSVLVGDMSAVGPRAMWTAEEAVIESTVPGWHRRWFVKPGLTGAAQVAGVTSAEPRKKLRYDVAYIRRRSLRGDAVIVARQLWQVATTVGAFVRAEASA